MLSTALLSDAFLLSCLQQISTPYILQESLNILFPQSYLSQRRGQVYDPFDGSTTLWGAISQITCIFINTPLIIVSTVTFVLAILRLFERVHLIRPAPAVAVDTHNSASTVWSIYAQCSIFHDYMVQVFYVGNHYGLFATMTKQRDELVIEIAINPEPGKSYDPRKQHTTETAHLSSTANTTAAAAGMTSKEDKKHALRWYPIHFKYKPDDLNVPPKSVFPFFHMPRLDWCMWFIALKPSIKLYPKWLWNFLLCLFEHETDVLQLLHPQTITQLQTLRADIRHQLHTRKQHASQMLPSSVLKARKNNSNNKSNEENSNNEFEEDDEENQVIDSLLLRVSLWRYNYTSSSSTAAAETAEDAKVDTREDDVVVSKRGTYWTAVKIATLLEPINRNNLLRIYEQFQQTNSAKKSGNNESSAKPTVESAQDIISRTLFKNVQVKRRQKELATAKKQISEGTEEQGVELMDMDVDTTPIPSTAIFSGDKSKDD